MASSVAVTRFAAAEESFESMLAANNDRYYEQQYNRIRGHNSSGVSHSTTKPHSTSKIEEEEEDDDDDDDDGLNIIPPSCNEDEDDSEDEVEDVVGHETKTTMERRRKKQPCHRNNSLNRSLIGIIKPPRTKSQYIMDTSILRGCQGANFDSLFDSVVSEMGTRKVRNVDFSSRLEIYFFK